MATRNEQIRPYRPVPPGEVLKAELQERGLTQKALAGAIHKQPAYLSLLIHGHTRISDDVAQRLEQALDIPAHVWLNLQSQYDAAIKSETHSKLTVTLSDPSRLSDVRRAISRMQGVHRVSVI